MAKCWIMLADGARPEAAHKAEKILAWNDSLADAEALSLSAIMHDNLLSIRDEHMRWAYDMGLAHVNLNEGAKTLAESLECGEKPSMWWTSILYERHPKISPELFPIYKLRALEMLFQKDKPDVFELHGGDRRLRRILKGLCENCGIQFIATGKGMRKWGNWLQEIYHAVPAPFRAIARFAYWWLTIRRKLPLTKSLPTISGSELDSQANLAATIVTYFPNIDLHEAAKGKFLSRYWESLHGALNSEARLERPAGGHFVRWLFIRFPAPHLSFQQCRDFCRLFAQIGTDGLSFNYLEEFLSTGDMAACFRRWIKLCLASWKQQKFVSENAHFTNSRLDFWELIKWDYAESFRGWRCLERSLQNRAFENYFRLAGRQRWSLYPLENCPWERMLVWQNRAASANNPVFGAQHSIIRPTDFRYFDDPRTFADAVFAELQPDCLGGNGWSAISQWQANGAPHNRLRQLEALRYIYLSEHKARSEKNSSLFPSEGEPIEPFAEKWRLLVLTSFFADETDSHLDLLQKAMESGLLDGWQISIKPHPVRSIQRWLDQLPHEMRKRVMELDSPLAILLQAQELVWTSNSTTASLEAALKGLPVMVMAPANDFDLCPIQNIPGLARTRTLEDVAKALEKPDKLILPKDYLDLNPDLEAWRKLLGLRNQPAKER